MDDIEQKAYAAIGKRLVGELREGRPSGTYWTHGDEPVWHTYVDSSGHIGADRVLVISKVTGEILMDQMVGE